MVQQEKPRWGFTNDIVFWKTLSGDWELTAELLRAITGRKVEITDVQPQEPNNVTITGHGTRYDVRILTSDNGMTDIEMQKYDNKDLAKRSRYYMSVNDAVSSKKGNDWKYNDLPETQIIFICCFDPFGLGREVYFGEEKLLTPSGRVSYTEDSGLIYTDVTTKAGYSAGYTKIFVNASKNATVRNAIYISPELSNFVAYIREGTVMDRLTGKIDEHVREINDIDREALMTQDEIFRAERNEGRRIGLMEGKRIGEAKNMYELVRDGLLEKDIAAKRLGCSWEKLVALAAEND